MTDAIIKGCKQASCNIVGDGRCIEQNLPTECPYILWVPSAEIAPEDIETDQFRSPTLPTPDTLQMYLGDELTAQATYPIMRTSLTHVIALAGGQECGKTSLLTCLYDRFQSGAYGGYLFAGSKTLPGFEQRCFGSRPASGKAEATMERTPDVDEFRFLHLAVRRVTLDAPVQHLLFSDITGEAFNAARQTEDGVKKLTLFRRADHFAVLINGENIVSLELRHKETTQIKTLLRGLIEGAVLTPYSFVDVIVSKWDLILTSPEADTLQALLKRLQKDIESRYGSKVARLSFHKLAALPGSDIVSRGFGLETLLHSWVESSAFSENRKLLQSGQTNLLPSKRAFLRYRYQSE